MAESSEAGASGWPPDPSNFEAIKSWLKQQPNEWSVVIASRAALRVLPFVRSEQSILAIVLPFFRATAVARFAAKFPSRAIEGAARAAARAVDAASGAPSSAAFAAAVAGSGAQAAAIAASAVPASAAFAAAVAASGARTADAAAVAASLGFALDAAQLLASAVTADVKQLHDGTMTSVQLAAAPLWLAPSSAHIGGMWQGLKRGLGTLGPHWSIWIDWYDNVVAGEPHGWTSEAEDAAFTDLHGELPWKDGAEAVNREIARRLRMIRGEEASQEQPPPRRSKAETIARLAEVASPQPSINNDCQLDAGSNKPFDVPEVDEDLVTLPLRQRNLIGGILQILPSQAPPALEQFLRFYDEELKKHGTQPILGLLKDDADIIVAAVRAPRAEDEWLEAGVRKAFDRFQENHKVLMAHFPLDAEREKLYSETPVDEGKAAGKDFSAPFEGVAIAAKQAHDAGFVTGDFLAAAQGMSETAQVLSTLPLARGTQIHEAPNPDITLSDDDRIVPVSTKQRVVLNGLGFYSRADQRLADTANMVTIASAAYQPLATALKSAVDALSKFLNLPG